MKLTIKLKLAATFLIIFALSGAAIGLSIRDHSQTKTDFDTLADVNTQIDLSK